MAGTALLALLAFTGCGKSDSNSVSAAAAKTKFRVQEVADKTQGGLVGLRYAVPQDWKADGRFDWNYSDLYTPLRVSTRAEAPDGSAWVETYPAELFYWLDPRWDGPNPTAPGKIGGIHHRDIRLMEAMQRYILTRYRGKEKNLQILGARPVTNLPQALGQPATPGNGVCIRIRYESGADTIDEEFYGFMTDKLTIPYNGPQGTTYEYHRSLSLLHSIGAKNNGLESMRPVLGLIASSFQVDKVWLQRYQAVTKQLSDAYQQALARGYAQIAAAGQLSRAISANNDAMIAAMDQQRAQTNAASARADDRAYKAVDNFDGYIRGTEKVEDSYGQVSEQPSQYNYHWADGFGNFAHSDDPDFDPNRYVSGAPFQRTTPAK
ncbi:MAG: hypothetical protein WDO18_18260 [Acidobacteriota bacterium]